MELTYPPDLPITERRADVLDAISNHQVVVIAGETGSGKSTQLPKMCLELGRGIDRWIGHTQPRRIAARSLAERVSSEMESKVGDIVGYTVRFTDEVGPDTRIKLMTDGILLAEVQRDRMLNRYDTIIIDEAHERSLNIDFLMGYLHQLLPRRADLKVIITSATIDTERFSAHFGGAPVVEVSGRAYPVDVRYAPLDDPEAVDDIDQNEGICRAVTALQRHGPGDVLVFCSGEREIRDAAQALRGLRLPDTEILPLYARLSSAEQHRVFQAHTARRIVLATNVAETSLTVPGIRYVVDPGTARISRYSHRTKVQRLPIEPISKASADQRAGRCGRVGPGVCIRLYSEDDLAERPLFTEPEIQRTNLASVILKMGALGLGEVEDFPFVDPPDIRAIRDGIALLEELGAVDPEHAGTRRWLTTLGRQLAELPIDPRLGRMILEAADTGCLHEVMVIAAGLSIQDPRERPSGPDQAAAAELHRRFDVEGSDFLAYLELWEYLHTARRERSGNQFRVMCKSEFLHVLRIREWQDLYTQLRRVAGRLRLERNREPATPDQIHRSLLVGLLSHVGMYSGVGREYRGARNSRFTIARDALPGAKAPRWVMAAELVETNRVWARGVARVNPDWIEEAAQHLIDRRYGEPWWDREQGAALTTERVTLYGLPLAADRRVQLGRVDPEAAHRMFLDHALVSGEWERRHQFIDRNAERADEVDALAAKVRRDLRADPSRIMTFFAERVPDHIVSARQFDRWWSRRRRRDPDLLDLPLQALIDPAAGEVDPSDYPDTWSAGEADLPLHYHFEPGSPTDGITVEIPVSLLGQLDPRPFQWHIPGYRAELIDALVRSLPKAIRRNLVPVPDTVDTVLSNIDPTDGDLLDALRRELKPLAGQPVPRATFDLDRIPTHLRISFAVVDDERTILAIGDDLTVIRHDLGDTVRAAIGQLEPSIERSGLTAWPGGDIPRVVTVESIGHQIDAFPALVDQGETVALRLMPDRDEQAAAMWDGTRRLLRLTIPAADRALGRLPSTGLRRAIATSPYADDSEWREDLLVAVFDHLMDSGGGPAWTAEVFAALRDHVRDELGDALREGWRGASEILDAHHQITATLLALKGPGFAMVRADIGAQLDRLVYQGSLTGVGVDRMPDIVRYLRAIQRRLERLGDAPERDRERMAICRRLEADYDALRDRVAWSPELEEIGWMLEELRVATFAQHLGTARAVSEKRIWTAMGALDG